MLPAAVLYFGPQLWFRFATKQSSASMKSPLDVMSRIMYVQGRSWRKIFCFAYVRKRESLKNNVNVIPSNCRL